MNGVRVKFLNRDEILDRLMARAQQLMVSRTDVLEVSLFGSLVRGNYAPGSDADIYILLQDHPRRFIDRIPEFLDHFSGIGLPVEVFPYTIDEVDRMQDDGFMRALQKEKMLISSRDTRA